jgi:hypothetical protein
MGAYDYAHITALTNQEARTIYAGDTAGAALLSGEHYPVGALGTTQDGRWYRFCQNGATALVAGSIYTGPVLVAAHVNNTATATAIGATTVTFTQGATAITRNYFKGGTMTIDVTPGGGYTYGIDAHDAVGSATAYAWPLAPGEAIQVALTTTSRISLVSNPYRNLVIAPTTTLAAAVAGVAISLVAAKGFGWLQTKGNAAVLTDGTVIIGNSVYSPSTNTAGACVAEGSAEATHNIQKEIGSVLRAAASTAFSTVNLDLA